MVVILSELQRFKTFPAPAFGEFEQRSFSSSLKLLHIVDDLEIKDAVMITL